MKKKKIIVPIVVAVAAAATIGTTAYVHAQDGFSPGFGMFKEKHENMKKAIEEDNYDAWREGVMSGAEEMASEESFSNAKEIHKLVSEGKLEEAKQKAEELGVPMPKGRHGADMSEIKEAIDNEDYEAWKTAMEEKMVNRLSEIESKINEETFNQLVEVHKLIDEGKFEEAQQLKEEIGLSKHGAGKGHHKF